MLNAIMENLEKRLLILIKLADKSKKKLKYLIYYNEGSSSHRLSVNLGIVRQICCVSC